VSASSSSSAESADYFTNHARKDRFPWSFYHRALTRPIARAIAAHGSHPRVLIVGCGLESTIPDVPDDTEFFGCDLDPRAIEQCQTKHPKSADHYAVCPSPYDLPTSGEFSAPFDVVVAKEVIEHTLEPSRWAKALAARLVKGGTLLLSTPNYGRFSTLPIIESTVLELIARRQGFSRRHIHPTKFDRQRLAELDLGPEMKLTSVKKTRFTGWSLLGTWQRVG
jgi:2-polyprenyl-3-methyl-5-hydroxy-6-metoxy-1,4-benzoquinol methylase